MSWEWPDSESSTLNSIYYNWSFQFYSIWSHCYNPYFTPTSTQIIVIINASSKLFWIWLNSREYFWKAVSPYFDKCDNFHDCQKIISDDRRERAQAYIGVGSPDFLVICIIERDSHLPCQPLPWSNKLSTLFSILCLPTQYQLWLLNCRFSTKTKSLSNNPICKQIES